jgi:transcriptional regulator with XRE-family HTH domain
MTFDVLSIGRRVARFRKLNGQTADELANLLGEGLTRAVIANIESGRKKDLTVSQLLDLAAKLDVPPGALLFDTTHPWAPSGVEINSPKGTRTLDNWQAIEWLSGEEGPRGAQDGTEAHKSAALVLRALKGLVRETTDRASSELTLAEIRSGKGRQPRSAEFADYLEHQIRDQTSRIRDLIERLQTLGVDVDGWDDRKLQDGGPWEA